MSVNFYLFLSVGLYIYYAASCRGTQRKAGIKVPRRFLGSTGWNIDSYIGIPSIQQEKRYNLPIKLNLNS